MKDRLERIIKSVVSNNVTPLEAIEALAYLICDNAYIENGVDGVIKRVHVFEANSLYYIYDEKLSKIGDTIEDTFDISMLDNIYRDWCEAADALVILHEKYQERRGNALSASAFSWMHELAGFNEHCSKVVMPFEIDYSAINDHPEVTFYCNALMEGAALSELYGKVHENFVCDAVGFGYAFESVSLGVGEADAMYIPFLPVIGNSKQHSLYIDNVRQATELVKEGGRIVIAVPAGFLQSSNMRDFRLWMISHRYLRQVIRVHGREFGVSTNANFYILVLEKSENEANSYWWVMPTKSTLDLGDICIHADSEAFLQEIRSGEYSAYMEVPYLKTIQDEAKWLYDPLSDFRDLPKKEGWKSVALSEVLAKCDKMERVEKGEQVRLLSLNLNSTSSIRIDSTSVGYAESKGTEMLLTESALCVNLFNLSYAWVDATPADPIAIGQKVRAYRIKDDRISPAYLCSALSHPAVLRATKRFRDYYTGSYIRPDFIYKIRIYLPDAEGDLFRDAIERAYQEAQEALLSDKERELKAAHESFAKSVNMRKHALGQTIYALRSDWEFLESELRDLVDCDTEIGAMIPMPIYQVLDNITRKLNFAEIQLKGIDIEKDYGAKENFDIVSFLGEYIATHGSVEYSFEENISQCNPIMVKGKKRAFQQVLDNLISNAVAHAFKNFNGKHSIKIECSEEREYCEVSISNTGIPVAEKLRDGSLFVEGESTNPGQDGHAGIGCAQIKELVEADGGSVRLKCSAENEFVTEFIITIPKSEDYAI